jgi:hypothetical protein
MTNIKAFINGRETKDWVVSDITIGRKSIGGPDQQGRSE